MNNASSYIRKEPEYTMYTIHPIRAMDDDDDDINNNIQYSNITLFSKFVVQSVGASSPGVCHVERHSIDPRPTNYFLSVPFTLCCMSLISSS